MKPSYSNFVEIFSQKNKNKNTIGENRQRTTAVHIFWFDFSFCSCHLPDDFIFLIIKRHALYTKIYLFTVVTVDI